MAQCVEKRWGGGGGVKCYAILGLSSDTKQACEKSVANQSKGRRGGGRWGRGSPQRQITGL